jgi:hypothetical protein
MSHARRTIREAVVTALAGAGIVAAGRVHDHPYNPRTAFPALVIEDVGANFSDGNVTEAQSIMALGTQVDIERRYRFAVIVEVQQSTQAARERDDLCAEVETAMDAAFNAGDIPGVKHVHPIAYQASDSNEGEKPIRRGLQVFEALYITPLGAPSTFL